MFTLRPYQEKCTSDLREAYRNSYRKPLLVSPVASGKTVMFAYITLNATVKGKRGLILVHRKELLDQCDRALLSLDVPHGIIAPHRTMTVDAVQIASVQTLVRRLDKVIPPDFIIIDEAHHAAARTWERILSYFPGALVLGVTATPYRLDGRGLARYFDMLVVGPQPKELIEQGFLSPPIVYAPPANIDLSGVRTVAGDFDKEQLEEIMDNKKIIGDAVAHYLRICPGVPAIAFCVSIKHAENTAEAFRMAGVRSESIDGRMNNRERESKITGLANGNIQVLTSCDIVSEGTDIPVVGAAILLRPTKSLALYIQQTGRAMRIYPGKKYSIILDHVGNVYRHGLPDKNRDWKLTNDRVKTDNGEAAISIKQCPECFAICSSSARQCVQCGHVFVTLGREVEEVDGELVPINLREKEEQLYGEYGDMERKKWIKKNIWRAETLEDFQKIAEQLGYNPVWAKVRYGLLKKKRQQEAAKGKTVGEKAIEKKAMEKKAV